MTLELRPLTIAELLDRAFGLYRRHLWLFVGIMAGPSALALTLTLLMDGVQRMVADPASGQQLDPTQSAGRMVALSAGMGVVGVTYLVVYIIALGAMTLAVSEIYVGREVSIGEVYGRMRGRIGSLLVLMLLLGLRLTGLALLGLIVLGVGSALAAVVTPILSAIFFVLGLLLASAATIYLSLRWGVAVPALILESCPPGEAIRRSIELTRGRLGRVFLLIICALIITYAVLLLFQVPFIVGATVVGPDTGLGYALIIAGTVLAAIGTMFTAPIMIIGLAVLYYDARIRDEGLDLQLMMSAMDGQADAALPRV
jgi:hypothetical protein